jgi:glycosyltransferase involved in cell wall biosynthesis
VTFTGGLSANAVRDMLRRATVSVNLSPPGLFDKAALESMLVGVPTIVSNPAFEPLLGDHVPLLRIAAPDDSAELAARLKSVLALSSEERETMGLDIRERVKAAHSLDRLMDRLVALMAEACR